MLAGKYNMVCDQGSTFTRTIEIKEADGTVFSLNGYTARMEVRRTVDASTALISLTNTDFNPRFDCLIDTKRCLRPRDR